MKDIHLLVVEDDLEHFRLINDALRSSGVEQITHFLSGEAFLDFLSHCPVDERSAEAAYCILLDVRLPGISGEDVLKKLKSRKDWSRIPVFVLTTAHDPELISRCHRQGCSYFISKPVDAEAFRNAIAQLGSFVNLVELPNPFRKV